MDAHEFSVRQQQSGWGCWWVLVGALLIAACGERSEAEPTAAASRTEQSAVAKPDTRRYANFEQSNRHWRKKRLAHLTEPYGWLSLVGLELLDSGQTYAIGSGEDQDIDTTGGPSNWGDLAVDDHSVVFTTAEDADVQVNGKRVGSAPLVLAETDGEPTRVEADGIRFHLVNPGGKRAVRIRNPQAPSRQNFKGLDYYELDPEWRKTARFVKHPEGTTIEIANVLGQVIEQDNPGKAVFKHNGKTFELEAVDEGEEYDQYFYILADRTSGRETYGLGRFLYADPPENGTVVLDFNQTYNPPCAFNAYTTCPLPPQSNRMDVWLRAGEKKYQGKPGIEKPKAKAQ